MISEQNQKTIENQIILDRKLDQIIREINIIKQDLATTISNQLLLEEYFMDITERLKRIEKKLSK